MDQSVKNVKHHLHSNASLAWTSSQLSEMMCYTYGVPYPGQLFEAELALIPG